MPSKRLIADGGVDRQNGCIVTENGVQKLKHPNLSYVAERTGSLLIRSFASINGYRSPNGESTEPEPSVARKFGYVAIGSVALAASAVGAVELGNILPDAAQLLENSIENFTKSISTIRLSS